MGFVDFVLLWIWSSSPFWFVSLSEIDGFNDSFALPLFSVDCGPKNAWQHSQINCLRHIADIDVQFLG